MIDLPFFKPFFFSDVFVFFFFLLFTSSEICRFYLPGSLNQYLPAIIIVITLLSPVSLLFFFLFALRYRSIWKQVFYPDTLHLTHLLYPYKLPVYNVGSLSNSGFLSVFSSLVFHFLMRRPTCVQSLIVSLAFLYAACGCFRRYEEIGGP